MFEKRGITKLKNSIYENIKLEMDTSTINIVSGVPAAKSPLLFVEEIMSELFPDEYSYKK